MKLQIIIILNFRDIVLIMWDLRPITALLTGNCNIFIEESCIILTICVILQHKYSWSDKLHAILQTTLLQPFQTRFRIKFISKQYPL